MRWLGLDKDAIIRLIVFFHLSEGTYVLSLDSKEYAKSPLRNILATYEGNLGYSLNDHHLTINSELARTRGIRLSN